MTETLHAQAAAAGLSPAERAVEGRGTKRPKKARKDRKARKAQNRAKTGPGATNAPDVGVESQGQEKVAEKPETRERRKGGEQLAAEFEAELTRPVVVRFGYRDTESGRSSNE